MRKSLAEILHLRKVRGKDPALNEHSILMGTTKWENLLKVHKQYTTDEMLRMVHHPYDSQKNESLNQKVATFAPKNKTFCTTMSLADRIALVVVTDSVGYSTGISRIISRITGRTAALSPVVRIWLTSQDKNANRKKEYQEKTTTKRRRAHQVQERIKQCIVEDKKAQNRGLFYGSGIAIDGVDPVEALNKQLAEKEEARKKKKELLAIQKERKKKGLCIYCGGSDHKKRTSKNCGEHQNYLAEKAGKKRKTEGHNEKPAVGEEGVPVDWFETHLV